MWGTRATAARSLLDSATMRAAGIPDGPGTPAGVASTTILGMDENRPWLGCEMPNHDLPDSLRIEMLQDMPIARFAASPLLFDHAVSLITGVIRRLASDGVPHLLIDASRVRFSPPSLVDRLRMVREWADAAEGRVRIAMLTRPEFIDPDRFGIIAAGNFGLAAQVFDVEADAIAWLRDERSADLQRSELRPAPRT